jgi:hypothetical protein
VATRRAPRFLAAVFLSLGLSWVIFGLVAAQVSVGAGATPEAQRAPGALARSFQEPAGAAIRADRLARSAIAWHGGAITTSTGESVTVYISDSYAPELVTQAGWAEFLAKLTHGPELSELEMYIAPLNELQGICGPRALGCYSGDRMFALGEPSSDGTTPDEVVRHEYGHHIAFHRLNAPWQAIDWGPKRWASATNVCAKVSRGEAFPGTQGQNYPQNPGEAWAEVYRLLDERKAGITTARWQIVTPDFFPDEAALQAAELDVLDPWTTPQTSLHRRTFKKTSKRVWWISLQTALDGSLSATATLPERGQYKVELVGANRRTVLARALSVGRVKRISAGICGQRTLFVRVTTPKGALGRITVTAKTP